MKTFIIDGKTWHWNSFAGFFFIPVGPGRKRERVVKSGDYFNYLYKKAQP
jgi:hypothetical protein